MFLGDCAPVKVCVYTETWTCVLCPGLGALFLSGVLQVAAGVMGRRWLGFWRPDALLIGAYQVFLGKTPEAFVQPSSHDGAIS